MNLYRAFEPKPSKTWFVLWGLSKETMTPWYAISEAWNQFEAFLMSRTSKHVGIFADWNSWGKQIFRIFPCYEVHSPNRSEILQSPQSGTLHRIHGLVSEGCPICFFPTCYIRILVHHRPRSQPEPLHNDKYHSTRGIPSQIDCAKERHSSDTGLCLQRPGFPSRIFPNLFPICIELLIDSLAFLGSWSSKRWTKPPLLTWPWHDGTRLNGMMLLQTTWRNHLHQWFPSTNILYHTIIYYSMQGSWHAAFLLKGFHWKCSMRNPTNFYQILT